VLFDDIETPLPPGRQIGDPRKYRIHRTLKSPDSNPDSRIVGRLCLFLSLLLHSFFIGNCEPKAIVHHTL
jgi:hypothetical protein